MTCKLLFFDYRKSEEKFFSEHKFDNYEIKFFKESLNIDTVNDLSQEDLEESTIISVFITSDISEEVISKFKNLRVISTRSTGYNHICLNTCANRNIAVLNVDAYGNTAVAQFTIGLILMLVRNIVPALKIPSNEVYSLVELTGHDLNNMVLGVVGTGAIGSSVARYAKCFGMSVVAYDKNQNNELIHNNIARYVELENLLKVSDIITVHSSYTDENYQMFSKEQFDLMKDGTYFVNVARGELVNNNALLEALNSGKLSGAALDVVACCDNNSDVCTKEKSSLSCAETSKIVKELSEKPNVIITPHIAYNTQEAINYILQVTFAGITDYISGGFKYRVL